MIQEVPRGDDRQHRPAHPQRQVPLEGQAPRPAPPAPPSGATLAVVEVGVRSAWVRSALPPPAGARAGSCGGHDGGAGPPSGIHGPVVGGHGPRWAAPGRAGGRLGPGQGLLCGGERRLMAQHGHGHHPGGLHRQPLHADEPGGVDGQRTAVPGGGAGLPTGRRAPLERGHPDDLTGGWVLNGAHDGPSPARGHEPVTHVLGPGPTPGPPPTGRRPPGPAPGATVLCAAR